MYGGTIATADSFSQYVTLFIHSVGGASISLCGGTLFQNGVVVTAAHCILSFPVEAVTVISADESQSTVSTEFEASLAYDSYADNRWQDDVAVVRLSRPMTVPMTHSPDIGGSWAEVRDSTPLYVVGRGMICGSDGPECQSRTLMLGRLDKVDRPRCEGRGPLEWPPEVLGNALCAGGGRNTVTQEACPGDSGGPLFGLDGRVYGAVSGGDVSRGKCGASLRPTLFAGFNFNRGFLASYLSNVNNKRTMLPFEREHQDSNMTSHPPPPQRSRGTKRRMNALVVVTAVAAVLIALSPVIS